MNLLRQDYKFITRTKARAADFAKTPAFVFFKKLAINLQKDYTGLIAAGLAFYFLMASFPALTALISLFGLFSSPEVLANQIQLLSHFLPPESLNILATQANNVVATSKKLLGFSLIASIIFSFYSGTQGIKALIKGLNIAYNEKEKRNFLKGNITAILLTLAMMSGVILSLALIVGLPAVLKIIPLPYRLGAILLLCRWPLLLILAMMGFEVLYRYGPTESRRAHHFLSVGSWVGTLLWLGMSGGFSMFVTNFGHYNQTYGSLSAVVILLLWFWLSAYVILLGAEINNILYSQENDTVH